MAWLNLAGISAAALSVSLLAASAGAQMVTGRGMADFAPSFGLDGARAAREYETRLVSISALGNILFPGEQPELRLQIQNRTDKPITACLRTSRTLTASPCRGDHCGLAGRVVEQVCGGRRTADL